MAYLLHVVAREVPAIDADVFAWLDEIAGHTVSMAPSQQLKNFRDAILQLFPCLTSYGPADARIADCPWADGPLGDNFKGGYGSVAISRRHAEVIPPLLRIASDLGLTIVDEQEGAVHRPQTYQVVLEGAVEGVDVDVAAKQLAELMNQSVEQMVQLLHSRRRTLVKRGLSRAQGEIYVAALLQRANCVATIVADARKPAAAPAQAKAPAARTATEAQRMAAVAAGDSLPEGQKLPAARIVLILLAVAAIGAALLL